MFDPGGDFLVLDGVEPVTVVRPGSSAATEVAHALRLRETLRGAGSPGGVGWWLPRAELPEVQAGDVLIDAAGRRYTVGAVRREVRGTVWRCTARDLAAELDTFVDIERAELSHSPAGAEVAAWHVLRSGVPARIAPIADEDAADGLRSIRRRRAAVLLPSDAPVAPGDRLVLADGSRYAVAALRAGTLLELDTERLE